MTGDGLHAWVDASAGVAGDMLLGALLDAGADLERVQAAVDAVVPGSVAVEVSTVTRAGLRATKADVRVLVTDVPHRTWASIRGMLGEAEGRGLPPSVGTRAVAVFSRLAEAEGRVHGIPAEDVHFHEVGALDSIADVVGVCAALDDLGVATLSASPVAVGSGHVRSAHGRMPVPVPAVVELSRGWRVVAGGEGELTTPTGMALVTALATTCEDLPSLQVRGNGTGAGTRDTAGRANVTRTVLGEPVAASTATAGAQGSAAVLLECNVDDLDPRLWPGVLERLLRAGADDAWLTPILMKKGRPAHLLGVLCAPDRADELRTVVLATTTTFGVRHTPTTKVALPRDWREVGVDGEPLPVKIAHVDGRIVQVTPEFEAVAERARRTGRTEADVLTAAVAAAAAAGLVVGGALRRDAVDGP